MRAHPPTSCHRLPPLPGQGVSTDERLPLLLRVAEQEGMRVALHLEPYAGAAAAPAALPRGQAGLGGLWAPWAGVRLLRCGI